MVLLQARVLLSHRGVDAAASATSDEPAHLTAAGRGAHMCVRRAQHAGRAPHSVTGASVPRNVAAGLQQRARLVFALNTIVWAHQERGHPACSTQPKTCNAQASTLYRHRQAACVASNARRGCKELAGACNPDGQQEYCAVIKNHQPLWVQEKNGVINTLATYFCPAAPADQPHAHRRRSQPANKRARQQLPRLHAQAARAMRGCVTVPGFGLRCCRPARR